jgi:hypothetical protein
VALGRGGEDDSFGQLRGHVLEGVNGEVYLPGQERLVELAGEHVAAIYDGERDVRVVLAGGLDDPDLDFEARRPQHPGAAVGLHEGEPGAPRPQDDGADEVHGDWERLGR